MNDYKACSKCGNTQPLENFRANKASKDGRQSACKSCQKAFYHANREQYREINRKSRLKRSGEARLKDREYYLRNRKQIIARVRAWERENTDRVRATRKRTYDRDRAHWVNQTRQWRQANRERARKLDNISAHRRRSRIQRSSSFRITEKEIARLRNSACVYCGDCKQIELDHIIPIARGGNHSIGNIAPACQKCNRSKGAKTITEWRKRNGPQRNLLR
jgi:5-methylcytosine-specific restriction endonuclease McrA